MTLALGLCGRKVWIPAKGANVAALENEMPTRILGVLKRKFTKVTNLFAALIRTKG